MTQIAEFQEGLQSAAVAKANSGWFSENVADFSWRDGQCRRARIND